MKALFFLLILITSLDTKAVSLCSHILEINYEELNLHEHALENFNFPIEGDFPLSFQEMRWALYIIYDRRDFYTGARIEFSEMTIDHVIPRSKGGPDNFFNYVPTSDQENQKKADTFDESHIKALEHIRDKYGPMLISYFKRNDLYEVYQRELDKKKRRKKIAEMYARIKSLKEAQKATTQVQSVPRSRPEPGIYVSYSEVSVEYFKFIQVVIDQMSSMSEEEVYRDRGRLSFRIDDFDITVNEWLIESVGYTITKINVSDEFRQERDDISGQLLEVINMPFDRDVEGLEVDIEFNLGFLEKIFNISRIVSDDERERANLGLFNKSVLSPVEYVKW